MKALFDEGVPRQLVSALTDHDISTVKAQGWLGIRNGKLLALVEQNGFEAFISCDQNLEFQQEFGNRPFATFLLSTNHWPTMQPNVPAIASALAVAVPGTVNRVNCGSFTPSKFKKSSGPPRSSLTRSRHGPPCYPA